MRHAAKGGHDGNQEIEFRRKEKVLDVVTIQTRRLNLSRRRETAVNKMASVPRTTQNCLGKWAKDLQM